MPIKCFVCGDEVQRNFATRSSKSRTHNAIVLSALSIYSSLKPEVAQSCFPIMNTSRKYMCLIHCTDVAQYLLAEVIRSGGKLSETLDHLSYINQSEVFEHIPALLNHAISLFAENITVTNYEVTRYLNDYLKRYYINGRWCTSPVTDPAEELRQPSSQQTTSSNGHAEAPEDQIGAPPVKKRNLGVRVTDTDDVEDGSFFSLEELLDDSEVPKLEETDPSLLDKDFVIKGRKLLELFNLTRCGCSDDGETGVVRLKQDPCGSVPVIEYVTKGRRPELKQWEGQEDTKPAVGKLFNGENVQQP